MLCTIKHHVLVHLVTDQQHVGGRQQILQGQHVCAAPDGGAWVVRAIDQDGSGARRQCCGYLAKVGAKGAWGEGHAHHHATGEFDVGDVAVVAGLQDDHFVTRVHDGQQGGDDRLGGTRGDGDFGVGVVGSRMQRFNFCRHGLAQRRYPGHGWVLVVARLHGLGDAVNQRGITAEIRKALAQVDRHVLRGKPGHDREDGGADLGQPGGERGRHSS